ncbi:sugar phosphate isomerase/epimerase family protein [Photobacterium minamisatsumaniensis]|uniref:sugar phosphate isomerase/epimerase family protein n=1 Tax=Photobacterium minamisatsumaniensis TaxID=2910233 RepID=UPI003D0D994A
MTMKVACAPCCWGVEQAQLEQNPSWGKVLVEAQSAGYQGIELGPVGFFPSETEVLRGALKIRGIQVCAGNLHGEFSQPSKKESILKAAEQVIQQLKSIGVDKLIIMDKANTVRDAYIGHSVIAPRLSKQQQQDMIDTIAAVALLAKEQGLRTLIHPSSGGYVAFSDEISAVMNSIPANLLGLCLDVGHLYIDGMKPEEYIQRYGDRLEHLHVKDIDGQQLHKSLRDRCGTSQAYTFGLTRPLGEGDIHYSEIFQALEKINYDGWIVVEQERPITQAATVKSDLVKSRAYLAELGV